VPGRAFFEEYDAVYKRRHQPEIQFKFHEEEATIGQPIELVRRFHELRTGQKITASHIHITAAEQTYATALLAELGFDGARTFLEYGIGRAHASNYLVNTLSGLKIYMADFLHTQAEGERRHRQQESRVQDAQRESKKTAYAAYCDRQADEYFANLSAKVREEIESEAMARIRARGGIFGQMTSPLAIRLERSLLIKERLNILSFDDWQENIQTL
jgi:hypothetical protein